MFGWTTSWPSEMNQNQLEYGGVKTPPSPWSSLLTPLLHPILPLIFLPAEFDCNKFWIVAMQQEYLSGPHAIVCELPFTKAKTSVAMGYAKQNNASGWGFLCFFWKTFPLWDNWLGVNTPSSAVRDCNPIPTKYRAGIAWCRYWYFKLLKAS